MIHSTLFVLCVWFTKKFRFMRGICLWIRQHYVCCWCAALKCNSIFVIILASHSLQRTLRPTNIVNWRFSNGWAHAVNFTWKSNSAQYKNIIVKKTPPNCCTHSLTYVNAVSKINDDPLSDFIWSQTNFFFSHLPYQNRFISVPVAVSTQRRSTADL